MKHVPHRTTVFQFHLILNDKIGRYFLITCVSLYLQTPGMCLIGACSEVLALLRSVPVSPWRYRSLGTSCVLTRGVEMSICYILFITESQECCDEGWKALQLWHGKRTSSSKTGFNNKGKSCSDSGSVLPALPLPKRAVCSSACLNSQEKVNRNHLGTGQ